MDEGIADGEVVNNIVQSTASDGIDKGVTGCSHNLTFQAPPSGSCTDRLTSDPELIFDGTSITGIQPTSPAKGSGLADHAVYGRFSSSYGLDIAVDRSGTPRSSSAWSRGAYE